MNLIQRSFTSLYPNRQYSFSSDVLYSGKFKPYNAKAQLRGRRMQFRLSSSWEAVDEDIVMGLIQSLLLRLFGGKQSTFNIQLYHSFLKKLPAFTPKKKSDPSLEGAFLRINKGFFLENMEQPTLQWGSESRSTLGHYDLHTDTITISTVFKNAPQHLLDYVLYHELLHKKHQFTSNGNQSRFHTKAFREDEAKFGDIAQLEKELSRLLKKRKSIFSLF